MTKRIIVLLVLLALTIAIGGEVILSAFALKVNAAEEVQSYDNSSIESDMANMEEAEYPANQFGECEVVGFMEYCYSENISYSSLYGLYVYVYNPTEKPLIRRDGANEIQMSSSFKDDGSMGSSNNYGLIYLDNTDNHRFYKFKVINSSEQYSIAKNYAELWNGKRRYEVTAINVMFEGTSNTRTNGVSKIYEYTGYAAWCGQPSTAVSTLNCHCYGGQSIHLEVFDTNYRFGHKGNNLYDDLQSVYFSLPNEYSDKWGNLNKITAEWYQYRTSPMFVTTNMEAYSALYRMRNKRINEYGQLVDENGNVLFKYPELYWRVLWDITFCSVHSDLLGSHLEYYIGKSYNGKCRDDIDDDGILDFDSSDNWQFGKYDGQNVINESFHFNCLDWIFPITKEIESIDDYRVSSEEVKKYIKDYTNAFSTQEKIQDRYASNLFERYDGDGYQSNKEFYDIPFWQFVDTNENQSFWESLWGMNETVTTERYSPIATISPGDFYLSEEAFSEKYFVNKDDVSEIISFAKKSYENNETPYLLRFAKTDYYASKARFDYAEEDKFDLSDVNGYVAQEYVFLDFDVLSLEYVSEDGFTSTLVGVVANSIDIINGLSAPEDIIENQEWWQKIMLALVAIFCLNLLSSLFPPVKFVFKLIWDSFKTCVSLLLEIILFPFKLIFGKK